jgi:NADP-dependent 3-hydroxy acid dehydrogenase YdfG
MRSEFRKYDFTNNLSMFDVNVNGPFSHFQVLLNNMIKNRSGNIVAITGVQRKRAPPFITSYAGSKHALIAILLQPINILF